ncbi:preprotein translocase subunit SecA, partial [Candidatus Nomurabacteria bacterium RIFCSPLOWO2_02_FULL_40_10]
IPSEFNGAGNSKLKNNQNDKLDEIRDTTGSFHVVHEFLRSCSRREAYEADITYGTNNEFGFDYLRDNLVYNSEQMVQSSPSQLLSHKSWEGKHNFAIIDEVDSILIDEARTPLIISVPDTESEELYRIFSGLIPRLKEEDGDYAVDEKMRTVSITEKGIEKVERMLGVKDIYTEKGIKYVHHLEQSLRAKVLFKRDKDYIVKNGQVIIIDEFTGRFMPGRRWSDGLHQAIEAKEGVVVQKESRTVAAVTFQNYFRMYKKLSGMTGTALTSAEEFKKVYNFEVNVIPTNRSLIRVDSPDKVFQTQTGKFKAVIEEIKERNQKGQPVLVGAISIEKNEFLSAMLSREGIKYNLLNAKNHEREAEIIAQAGKKGAVTVATNMAGRGVDIALGGIKPPKSISNLKSQISNLKIIEEFNNKDFEEWQKERDEVIAAGGLFVIGTERHEARRIDNQLRGRSGRQGDPGETQFFLSLEDDVLRIFGGDRLKNMMGTFGIPEDQPIESKLVSAVIESAQSKIEGMNFDARKYTLEYDDVINKHRDKIYEFRKKILFATLAFLEEEFRKIGDEETNLILNFYARGDKIEWNKEELLNVLKNRFGAGDENIAEISEALEVEKFIPPDLLRENLKDMIRGIRQSVYQKKKEELGENFAAILRNLFLQIIDFFWLSHIETMDYTRASVGLRAHGQRDPLVEYKNEAVRLFRELESAIKSNVFFSFFQLGAAAGHIHQVKGESPAISSAAGKERIGRNAPCHCGSGKKFKKCHGQ